MSIQGNINQMLSIASILRSQNPEVQERGQHKANVKRLETQLATAQQAVREHAKFDLNNPATANLEPDEAQKAIKSNWEDLMARESKVAGLSEELYAADPSESRLVQSRIAKAASNLTKEQYSKFFPEEKSTTELTKAQEAKRKSRRNFLDYMKDEPTSLGGTFGELSPKIQKELAKSYSKYQREQIMNRKDKELANE